MTRDRLSPMDVAFLDVEDPQNRAHLFGLLVFDGPAPTFEDFRCAIGACLPDLPRFRQRIARVPGGLHRPEWVDAEGFQIDRHLGSIELPPPGDIGELNALADELSSAAMDMGRPLWEMQLVTGLAGGQFAIAVKLHHSMVDGVSIMDVFSVLFSVEPNAQLPTPQPWSPQRVPGPFGLSSRATVDAARDSAAALATGIRHMGRVWNIAGSIRRTARLLGQAPVTQFNAGPSGSRRRNSWLSVPLSEFALVKTQFETTINNVYLAVIAGALRRHRERSGETSVPLYAFVPVSIRDESERGALGNRIGLTFPRLPVDLDDAVARLADVGSVVDRRKQWQQATDTAALLAMGGSTPPVLTKHMNRYIQLRSRLFNLTCTNVPGPRVPVYFCGRRLRGMLGSAPLTASHAVTMSALSYNGTMFIAVTSDPVRVPDGDRLIEDFRAELDELLRLAGGADQSTGTSA
ncbi:wax ester/triacylglycerol synthase family O-acyltransferase [Nocardia gamkensis]|uniref:wax ester/triacylglycerol synthase family O-acyltransferase n=1 Tax=Nocardia gamkensis TaxID=352869 RepID=UPI0033D049B3